MSYKTITHGKNRYAIVDNSESYGIELKVTPNLNENELKIALLEAKDCPAKDKCIKLPKPSGLPNRITSVCKLLGPYPDIILDNGDRIIRTEKIQCRYDAPHIELETDILTADKCPEERQSCIGCEQIKSIIIPPEHIWSPKKSHAYVVCERLKGDRRLVQIEDIIPQIIC